MLILIFQTFIYPNVKYVTMPKTASDRLYIDKDLREAFHYYAEDEKLRVPEELRGAITEEWLMRETLKNQVIKMGHYPLKKIG